MPKRKMAEPDRLAGGVWGHLVGDATGVPYEFKSPGAIDQVVFGAHGTHGQPKGTWSDDGSLMLAMLDSLTRPRPASKPAFDTADQATRFLAWVDGKAYTPDGDGAFDMGGACSRAFERLRAGMAAEAAGGAKETDNGNGSLMRILPLALVEREVGDDVLVDHAHRSSAITHAHPLSQAACALYVLLARRLLEGHARHEALHLARAALGDVYQRRDDAVLRLAARGQLEDWTGRAGRGFVIDAFWSAWDAFADAADYRETIERAIRYGHDTDTTAAIAGGLAGIRFGSQGIPLDWLTGMRGRSVVDPLVARLTGRPVTPKAGVPIPAKEGLEKPLAVSGTSTENPIRVAWIDLSQVPSLAASPGHLGMTFLPGKHDTGLRGAVHRRDLDADVARLRDTWGVDAFVLLVQDHEIVSARVARIGDVMSAHGIDLIRFPIVDGGTPEDESAFRALLRDVERRLAAGESVVVACRGGLGRTGTTVACILRESGVDAAAAIALTRAKRPGAIENANQEAFVHAWKETPSAAQEGDLPFERYAGGGRHILDQPRFGDGTARHGYGLPVFEQCGYTCVYCGLDMAATFESWLQLSVDHVVPRQMIDRGYDARHVESISNLVTCCRACNDFGNRFAIDDPAPKTDDEFIRLRDRVFVQRKATVLKRRAGERAFYARVASGPGGKQ